MFITKFEKEELKKQVRILSDGLSYAQDEIKKMKEDANIKQKAFESWLPVLMRIENSMYGLKLDGTPKKKPGRKAK